MRCGRCHASRRYCRVVVRPAPPAWLHSSRRGSPSLRPPFALNLSSLRPLLALPSPSTYPPLALYLPSPRPILVHPSPSIRSPLDLPALSHPPPLALPSPSRRPNPHSSPITHPPRLALTCLPRSHTAREHLTCCYGCFCMHVSGDDARRIRAAAVIRPLEGRVRGRANENEPP